MRKAFEEYYKIAPSGCWEWQGALNNGYGSVSVNGREIRAHRYSYTIAKGDIPSGLQIDHLCRNRACVNPEHLEAVSRRVNILRGEAVSAQNLRKTHCKQGHPFKGDNLILRWKEKEKTRQRVCRECRRTGLLKFFDSHRNKGIRLRVKR